MKKIFSLMVIFILLFSLCACGKEGNTPPTQQNTPSIAGKYILTKVVTKSNEVMTGEEYDRDEFSLTFREDGTVVFVTEGDVAGTLNWVLENDKLYIVSDGQREELSYSGNTVTMITNRGDTWTFTKQ